MMASTYFRTFCSMTEDVRVLFSPGEGLNTPPLNFLGLYSRLNLKIKYGSSECLG